MWISGFRARLLLLAGSYTCSGGGCGSLERGHGIPVVAIDDVIAVEFSLLGV